MQGSGFSFPEQELSMKLMMQNYDGKIDYRQFISDHFGSEKGDDDLMKVTNIIGETSKNKNYLMQDYEETLNKLYSKVEKS